jgi:hypothetical protein
MIQAGRAIVTTAVIAIVRTPVDVVAATQAARAIPAVVTSVVARGIPIPRTIAFAIGVGASYGAPPVVAAIPSLLVAVAPVFVVSAPPVLSVHERGRQSDE